MTFFPDMGTITMVAAGSHVRAVGWLDRDHEFTQGDVPARFVGRLKQFVGLWQESARVLGFPTFLGIHLCDFCGDEYGSGDFGVPWGEVLFVAPVLIDHYVTCHGCRPPADFVKAVTELPPPGTWRYWRRVRRFQHFLPGHTLTNATC